MHPIGKRFTTLALVLGTVAMAHADPTSGVDAAMFRPSYDSNGVFAVEGARLMPVRDLAFKILFGYGKTPLSAAVPGIGAAAGDTNKDPILDYLMTLDMTFGMTVTDHVAIGFDVAAYRTGLAVGYGTRGRYASGGLITQKSTGVLSLRPLSNIDPSASPDDPSAYLGDELAGPLDAHVGLKLGLYEDAHLALTAIGSVFLPFGDDYMLLGDRGLVDHRCRLLAGRHPR